MSPPAVRYYQEMQYGQISDMRSSSSHLPPVVLPPDVPKPLETISRQSLRNSYLLPEPIQATVSNYRSTAKEVQYSALSIRNERLDEKIFREQGLPHTQHTQQQMHQPVPEPVQQLQLPPQFSQQYQLPQQQTQVSVLPLESRTPSPPSLSPSQTPPTSTSPSPPPQGSSDADTDSDGSEKRRRGRPRKNPVTPDKPKRKRGRPRLPPLGTRPKCKYVKKKKPKNALVSTALSTTLH